MVWIGSWQFDLLQFQKIIQSDRVYVYVSELQRNI